jgi:hypothetical protein
MDDQILIVEATDYPQYRRFCMNDHKESFAVYWSTETEYKRSICLAIGQSTDMSQTKDEFSMVTTVLRTNCPAFITIVKEETMGPKEIPVWIVEFEDPCHEKLARSLWMIFDKDSTKAMSFPKWYFYRHEPSTFRGDMIEIGDKIRLVEIYVEYILPEVEEFILPILLK